MPTMSLKLMAGAARELAGKTLPEVGENRWLPPTPFVFGTSHRAQQRLLHESRPSVAELSYYKLHISDSR